MREPLLSDEDAKNILKNCAYNPRTMNPVTETRAFYESLIDKGELIPRDELVKWLMEERPVVPKHARGLPISDRVAAVQHKAEFIQELLDHINRP